MPYPDDYEVDGQIELEKYLRGEGMRSYLYEYTCDVCKKTVWVSKGTPFSEVLPKGWATFSVSEMKEGGEVWPEITQDICPECAKKLIGWTHNADNVLS